MKPKQVIRQARKRREGATYWGFVARGVITTVFMGGVSASVSSPFAELLFMHFLWEDQDQRGASADNSGTDCLVGWS